MWELASDAGRPEWRVVDTQFSFGLSDVVQTVEGPYAVGGSGTVVADRGEGWEVVFDDGPTTRQTQFRALDVTDDGERIWLGGSSGAMACYDVDTGRKYDYSYPMKLASAWEAVAVSGPKGREKLLAANDAGEVLPFVVDGFDVDWGRLERPAEEGSEVAALASTPDGVGFAVDSAGNAFTTTAEAGWTDAGVVATQVTVHDVYAGPNSEVYLAAGDGRIYRYDDAARRWHPTDVAAGVALRSFDVAEGPSGGKRMTVLGDDGTIYERAGEERWEPLPSPTDAALYELTLGEKDVAVGEGGTVVERPSEPRGAGSSTDVGDEEAVDGRGERRDERLGTE